MKLLRIILLALLLPAVPAGAQDTIGFRQGLAVANSHQYGRQAQFTDQLAARMYAPGYVKPVEGGVLFTNAQGEAVTWKVIRADSTGRFSGREAASGNIYLTYRSDRERGGILNIAGNAMCYWNGEAHPGDPYSHGWLHLPVRIHKGINELYIRLSGFRASAAVRLILPATPRGSGHRQSHSAKFCSMNSINLAKEVNDRILNGEFTWRDDFRDLHPSPFGHELYFNTIRHLFKSSWAKSVNVQMNIKPLPATALDPYSYTNGHFEPVGKAKKGAGWVLTCQIHLLSEPGHQFDQILF